MKEAGGTRSKLSSTRPARMPLTPGGVRGPLASGSCPGPGVLPQFPLPGCCCGGGAAGLFGDFLPNVLQPANPTARIIIQTQGTARTARLSLREAYDKSVLLPKLIRHPCRATDRLPCICRVV